ncbi:hypothetical protein [Nocardioides piscis]|uniref:Uncharacterized protein n=1 Tax=Nocardioides piscis TaxID=2714938 RepID=A0A6G7YCW7_9ACTN|nr:hypothetical protein [Nocardioides piscis]QIK74645.1 hypothetical protein G7071_03570 [Nocardioides piscis]
MTTWLKRLLLGLLGIYLAVGLAGTAGVLIAAASARHDASDGLPAAEREADQARAQTRGAMQSPTKGGPAAPYDPRPADAPSYSWRELRCEIRSIDSGWIAVDFEQACDLVDVDLYPTSLEHTERSQGHCQSIPTGPLFADVDRWPNDPGTTLQQPPASISVDLATGQQLQAGPRSVRACTTGIRTSPSSVQLEGHRPQSLPRGSSWVVVRRKDEVSRSRLGCNPWLVVFCASPLHAPWLPDP